MPRFSIEKMRRLSRSSRYTQHEEQPESAKATRLASLNNIPSDPPPSYEAVLRQSSHTAPAGEVESPPRCQTISPPYHQTHQPPQYQSTVDVSSRRIVTQTTSRESNTSSIRNGDVSLSEALRRAALAGKSHVVRSLLEAGAEIYQSRPFAAMGGTSAIHEALKGPEPELVLLLLDYPQERAYQGEMASTEDGMDGGERVKFLLSVKDRDGCTPLHLAASAGATEVVREMLGLGAAVDVKDNLGRTPLHMAARYSREEVMDVLLENGADPERVQEDMWDEASTRGRVGELGDYWFVTQCVAKAVRQRKREDVKEVEDVHAAHEAKPRPERKIDRADRGMTDYAWEASEDEPESGTRRPPQSPSAGSSSVAAAFGASIVSGSVRSSGGMYGRSQRGAAPSPAGFCTTWNHSVGRQPRRLPDPTMYSPEYHSWRQTCQTLQEEHRRQKERNAETGIGYGGLY